jgi:hypothetical protein
MSIHSNEDTALTITQDDRIDNLPALHTSARRKIEQLLHDHQSSATQAVGGRVVAASWPRHVNRPFSFDSCSNLAVVGIIGLLLRPMDTHKPFQRQGSGFRE